MGISCNPLELLLYKYCCCVNVFSIIFIVIPNLWVGDFSCGELKESSMEFGGDSGGSSGGDHPDASYSQRRRKRYHRHTAHQIQTLESMFKDCPHPDEKTRNQLSRELALHPRQIKLWFQNRRTQMKDKWVEVFPTIVLRARTICVISSGILGSQSGTLQLTYEELQVLTALLPIQQLYFLRFCQQIEQGTCYSRCFL